MSSKCIIKILQIAGYSDLAHIAVLVTQDFILVHILTTDLLPVQMTLEKTETCDQMSNPSKLENVIKSTA